MKSGWVTKKLGEVCKIIYGYPFDSKLFNNNQKGMPVIRIRDVVRGFSETYTTEPCDNKYWISEDDVLIGMDGDFNISTWKSSTALLNQRVCKLESGEKTTNLYLRYILPTTLQGIWDKKLFTTVKHLSAKDLNGISLPIPPLAEQKRIVAKIDAAFEKIDALKANAEKNLANAKELFQSALDEAMRPKKGWVEKRLGEVAEIQRGGSPRPIKDFITQSKDGYNWIKIGDVDPSGKFITSTAEKIRKEGLRKTRQVFAGEFLLSNSMSFGRPYILKIDGCIHDGWLVLRGFQKLYKEDFFYHLLRSKWIQNQFNSLAYGSTVRNLNSNSVSKVIVPIVALEEQQEIADSLDRLQSQAGVIQQNYARQIADCAEMRQAILREAFERRL